MLQYTTRIIVGSLIAFGIAVGIGLAILYVPSLSGSSTTDSSCCIDYRGATLYLDSARLYAGSTASSCVGMCSTFSFTLHNGDSSTLSITSISLTGQFNNGAAPPSPALCGVSDTSLPQGSTPKSCNPKTSASGSVIAGDSYGVVINLSNDNSVPVTVTAEQACINGYVGNATANGSCP
ncbi:MAG: hypothetical protein ACRECH_14810 [Nitrososphaerales archaeon]